MTRFLGDGWLLPTIDDRTREYFASGKLAVQTCRACGAVQYPPEDVCPACQGFEFDYVASAGEGRIESVAIVHHPVHPALAAVAPYAIVVVSVDDAPGVNMIGNVLGTPPDELAIGQRVRVVFEEFDDPETGDHLTVPNWERVA